MPVDPRSLGGADLSTMYDLLTAVAEHDHPNTPAQSRDDLEVRLARPWPGCRTACWLGLEDKRAVGVCWVTLPADANAARAELTLAVSPDGRRLGVGRGLLREAVRLAYSTGRTTMICTAADGDAALGFAAAIGARPALHLVRSLLAVPAAVAAVDDAIPVDHELCRLSGACPAELRAGIGAVHEGMTDAPFGVSGWVHQPRDSARVAAVDATFDARGLIQLRVLARHLPTGDIVGATHVIISPRSPYRSEQGDTTVLPAHRRRGVGLAMNREMLRWLRAEHPEVHELSGWVAQDNVPIRALNQRLGYQLMDHWTQWQAPVRSLAEKLGLVQQPV